MSDAEEGLSALLHETRTLPPPAELASSANAQPGIYEEAAADPLGFWAAQAERLQWASRGPILDWDLPFAKWFVGGTLNVAVNCVDRHVEAGLGDRVAFHWEGEPGRHPHDHLRRPAGRWCARPPTPSPSSACRPATRSPSTCR